MTAIPTGNKRVMKAGPPDFSDQHVPDRWTPDALVRRGIQQLLDDSLWNKTEQSQNYKEGLFKVFVAAWANNGTLTEAERGGMYKIVHYNNEVLEKRAAKERMKLVPPVPPPELPAAPPPPQAPEPLMTAKRVAQAFGFQSSTVLDSLTEQYADAPRPMEVDGRPSGLYFLSEWQAFDARHPGEIARRLHKAQSAATTRATKLITEATKDCELAELRAKNARLEARVKELE